MTVGHLSDSMVQEWWWWGPGSGGKDLAPGIGAQGAHGDEDRLGSQVWGRAAMGGGLG